MSDLDKQIEAFQSHNQPFMLVRRDGKIVAVPRSAPKNPTSTAGLDATMITKIKKG